MDCQLVTFLLLIALVSSKTNYLSFKHEHPASPSTISNHGETMWYYFDGNQPTNTIISIEKVFNNKFPNLELSCKVNELNQYDEIISAYFHVNINKEHDKLALIGTHTSPKSMTFKKSGIPIEYIGDNFNGYTIRTKMSTRPISGQFWCELENKNGKIFSNKIEFQDLDFYANDFSGDLVIKNVNNLTLDDFPTSFVCTSKRANAPEYALKIRPNIHWKICKFSDSKKCYPTKNPEDVSRYFEYRVIPDGTLILLKPLNDKSLYDFGIFCTKESSIFNVYIGKDDGQGINLIDTSSGYIPFKRISNAESKINLYEGRFSSPFVLFANYRSSRKLEWSRKNGNFDRFPEENPYMLTFPSVITPELEDIYTLGDDNQFVFDVRVVSLPKTRKNPPSVVYVTDDKSVQITAEFENANNYNYSINGLDDPTIKYPELRNMQIIFKPGTSSSYEVKNLKTDSLETATHLVTLYANNDHGSVFTNTLIRVLPLPKLENAIENGECLDDCLVSKPHKVKCNVDMSRFSDINSDLSWFFNSHNISQSKPKEKVYDYITVEGNTLTIQPIGNETYLKNILRMSNIHCRLRLFYMEENQAKIIFDSDTVPKNHLRVKLFDEPIIKPAFNTQMTWIASVVTAIAVILLFALGIAWYCMRNRGETYLVNAYEKAVGNDPEAEFRDVSAFQIYERPDTVPLTSCNQNIDDNDLEVNGQDDFLECDYSDEIMTKFNETGSFINGLYGDKTLPKRNVDELVESRKGKKV